MPVRVLIVDDSALMRQLLTSFLGADPEIEVVGTAADPYIAREKIKSLNPDVLTLDIEMPRMDGLTFLENLMRLRPMPVIMVSSLTEAGAKTTLHALELGAVDFVTKPKIDITNSFKDYAQGLGDKIKAAAKARPRKLPAPAAAAAAAARQKRQHLPATEKLIAIGASTGGTEAIKALLERAPADSPPILIVQHIPATFSRAFAERLDRYSPLTVSEATDGQPVLPGHAYVAPGDRHLLLARDGARYVCRLSDAAPESRHRPSVDVLFRSIAEQSCGRNALGILLTGMGEDGARSLLQMRKQGARTIAQDDQTSVVWGMPGAAVKLGAVDEVLPLSAIADRLVQFAGGEVDAVAAGPG